MNPHRSPQTFPTDPCHFQRDCLFPCQSPDDMMLTDNSQPQGQYVTVLRNDLNGLNEIYRELADEIGLENTLVVYRLFHGCQISFPDRLFSKEYIHKAILEEYNGSNAAQLAQKYNYSQRSIWRILKSPKE